MEQRENELKSIRMLKEKVQKELENAPEGRIWCQKSQGKYPQYRLKSKNEAKEYPRGRYLKKPDVDLAKVLVQKEYDMKFLQALEKYEKILLSRKEEMYLHDLQKIFLELVPAKQQLVTPHILSDADYLKLWYQEGKDQSNPFPIVNGFVTEKGETVRSKSEKMIADKFFYKGIPYKYEAPLSLSRYGTIYPDFTLLNLRKRKTVYLEHFGMMDTPEYCRKALERIELYEENKMYQGDRLLVTFESSLKSVNMKQVDSLISRFLM